MCYDSGVAKESFQDLGTLSIGRSKYENLVLANKFADHFQTFSTKNNMIKQPDWDQGIVNCIYHGVPH